ncbi:MAG: ATP-dependent helicase HrpB [Puniceicoccales bacterium]|jgi:ATP-dependent helicase HrpB|nr:ATP-dependent helicase HrpB [Puniceicoccales bacterium]
MPADFPANTDAAVAALAAVAAPAVAALPVLAARDTLLAACANTRRIVLQAPTGSGKSTQVPQILLDGRAIPDGQKIIILQPRRLATRMLAARIAHERGCELGGEVGYQIRFDRAESAETRIKFVTEGLLLRQMLADPQLRGVGALVFDEFHERHLDSDIALALARRLQETTRPDLLIVVMSATLDTDALVKWLGDCELLSVSGRLFPIATEYAGAGLRGMAVWDLAATHFRKAFHAEPEGDFLVFMPGSYEIQKTIDAIGTTPEGRDCLLLPLHGELPPERQDLAVAPPPAGIRKVVVATNVAETSLTIDGVRVVLDSGLARIARWDPRRGINTLLIENVSQASAEQRAGRAGRTAPGLCVRLWSKTDHEARPARETPEVRRVELAEPLLALKAGGVADLDAFPWFEKPEPASLARALVLLRDLGALDAAGDITEMGRRMAAFPMHPRYARMMLAARELGCERPVAAIAALTQGRDIMLPLTDRRDNEAREDLLGETDSDFSHRLTLLGMARKKDFDFGFCRRWGIHAQAARMADRLAAQFLRIAQSTSADPTPDAAATPPPPDAIRKCLLIGFSDHLAARVDKGTLRCALVHGRKGELRRQSAVRHAPLLVAAEVEEFETRGDVTVFLSLAAAVEEEWLAELFPDDFNEQTSVRYDAQLRRCLSRRERRFRDLVLEVKERDDLGSDAACRLLAEEVLAGRLELENWDAKAEAWVNKVNFAAKHLPELEIAPIDAAARRMLIEEICLGATAWHQVRAKDIWPTLRGWLTDEQAAGIAAMLPERIELPYKQRTAAIDYTSDGEAVVGARLQDLYDTPGSHFRIAGGRVPLVIEIQSPARRTFQRTQDLDAFWKTSYELVKKDLRGRYPKHEWR